jgi:hypothetical protein
MPSASSKLSRLVLGARRTSEQEASGKRISDGRTKKENQ